MLILRIKVKMTLYYVSLLHKISNTEWKCGMAFKRERKSNFKENGESYGESHVQSESC